MSIADLEAGTSSVYKAKETSTKVILLLAYQSFGVVYGDLSTSPLYVYRSTFAGRLQNHESDDEILGVLSLIFYTLTIIPLIKYVFIVLTADDNGEGGTFALYSLLCRHAKLSLLQNQQAADEELSTYKLAMPPETIRGMWVKKLLEKHENLRTGLLIVVLLGTCMVIGDGVLTPAISVLSAISGIQVAAPDLHNNVVVAVACIVLVGLFALQHYGTHRVAFMFAPIVIAWLFCISSIGIYNVISYNPGVFKALSPYYVYKFFRVCGKKGWMSLGGVVLCITGSEAMFADLGHFSQLSIKIAFTGVVYPCLLLAYMGQAAYLSKNKEDISQSFYRSIPKPVFWPVFIVATLASIVGSQAVISATFSIVKQCLSLGCFPRVKVVHTSNHIRGQIYIPEVNWLLLLMCLAITLGFQDTITIGNAYGLAVISVMLVTTFLMTLVIVIVWRRSIFLAVCFLLFFGSIEAVYVSASLNKVPQGGWAPLVLSGVFMCIMYVWHYGTSKKYEFDMQNKVSMKWILTLGPSLGIVRVPGIGLIYTELVTGVPPIFTHFVTNLPAFHKVLVFVSIKSVPVPYVPEDERYLVSRIGPKEYHMYRCVIRFGYKDIQKDNNDFENQLISNLGKFIKLEGEVPWIPSSNEVSVDGRMTLMGSSRSTRSVHALERDMVPEEISVSLPVATRKGKQPFATGFQITEDEDCPQVGCRKRVQFEVPETPDLEPAVLQELDDLREAKEAGVAYVLGHSYVKAKKSSSFLKRFAINIAYTFLRRNCRGPSVALSIPHVSLIEVGMIYYV